MHAMHKNMELFKQIMHLKYIKLNTGAFRECGVKYIAYFSVFFLKPNSPFEGLIGGA